MVVAFIELIGSKANGDSSTDMVAGCVDTLPSVACQNEELEHTCFH